LRRQNVKDDGSLLNATVSAVRIDRYSLMYSISFYSNRKQRWRYINIFFQLWFTAAFIQFFVLPSPLQSRWNLWK